MCADIEDGAGFDAWPITALTVADSLLHVNFFLLTQ